MGRIPNGHLALRTVRQEEATGAAGSWRALIFTGQSILQGAGQVTLSESLTNRIDGDGASRLTILNHTISGSGYLGRDGGGPLAITVGAGSVINVNGVYDDTGGQTTGEGTINANDALISGMLSPGSSVGTLHFNRLTLLDGATFVVEIDAPASDAIHVFGPDADAFQVEENATYLVDFVILGRGDGLTTEFPLIVWDSDLTVDRGVFDTLTWDFGRTPPGLLFGTPFVEFRPNDSGGGMLVLTNVRLVPEPTSFVLAALGLLLLALCARRPGWGS